MCDFINKVKNNQNIRILWIFVVPTLLAIWLFPYTKIPLDFDVDKVTHSSNITISEEALNTPIWKSSIRRLFNAPFDLDYYKVIIEDKSQTKDSETCNPLWNVTIGEKTNVIPYGHNGEFEMIQVSEDYFWSKNVILKVDQTRMQDGKQCQFSVSFIAYAIPYLSDVIVKQILFIAAWIGLHFLFLQAVEWCKKPILQKP